MTKEDKSNEQSSAMEIIDMQAVSRLKQQELVHSHDVDVQ